MNKQSILESVLAELKNNITKQRAANAKAADGATDSESRAETKWDTAGLEASYLARGYARQYEELAYQYDELRCFFLEDFSGRATGTGALIQCDIEGFACWFFLLPNCGGMEFAVEGEEVTVITPESPIGKSLMHKYPGDMYVLPNGGTGRVLNVL